MKILFVIPKNKSLFGDKGATVHPHIGIAYLSAFLKSKGIDVTVFDDGIESKTEKVFTAIDEFRPDIIGVTVFSYCYKAAHDLVREIKARRHIPLVLGGPHVSTARAEVLEETGVDFAVKHEGEYTLLELLKQLETQRLDFNRVNGLIWRNNGKVSENPDRPLIEDLDSLPFPDYDVFDIEHYACYRQRVLPLITSRGCPFGCNYCSVRLSMGQRFRARSARNVFLEIKYFYDNGWRSFDFNDDCFALDKKRAADICDLIIENNLNMRFQLYNGIRVDTVDQDLLRKMREAGCYFISYGCEAGNDRVLKLIKKGITLKQVREAVKWTNDVGIRNSVNFIIGHTAETYQDALDTISFAKSLPTNFVNFYNLLPYPGTESYLWANQHARFLVPPESYLKNISYRDNEPVFETAEFTKEERQRIVSMGFDLYRKKILAFRLGKALGSLVYYLTKNRIIDKFATRFALNNSLGRFFYLLLARKSFRVEEAS